MSTMSVCPPSRSQWLRPRQEREQWLVLHGGEGGLERASTLLGMSTTLVCPLPRSLQMRFDCEQGGKLRSRAGYVCVLIAPNGKGARRNSEPQNCGAALGLIHLRGFGVGSVRPGIWRREGNMPRPTNANMTTDPQIHI